MKATIISNGSTRIVLKPESPADLLAVKDLADKNLITLHYESTQILAESYPNCLVISEDKSTPAQKKKEDRSWVGVYDAYQQNKCLGLIPALSSQEEILGFILNVTSSKKVKLQEQTNELKLEEVFKVEIDGSVNEYFLSIVQFYIKGEFK